MCKACFSPSLSLYLSRYLSISFSLSHSAVRCLWEIVGKMQLVWWLHKNSNWIRRKRKRKCCVIPHISPMPHWEKLIANFWQVFLVSFHFATVVFLSVYSHVYTVSQFPLYARTPNSFPPPPPPNLSLWARQLLLVGRVSSNTPTPEFQNCPVPKMNSTANLLKLFVSHDRRVDVAPRAAFVIALQIACNLTSVTTSLPRPPAPL